MKSLLSVILISWIVLVPPAECAKDQASNTVAQSQEAGKYVEQGDILFNQGSYDKAMNAYTSAIELGTKLASAYWNRGRIYHFDKDSYPLAIDDYAKAIEIDPKYTKAFYYRGLAYMANGGYDRAISDFDRAIELDQGLANAYNMRAWCNVQKAQWDQSSQLYLYQLFESDSGLAEAYQGKGWIYVKQMQWELATTPVLLKSGGIETINADRSDTIIDGLSAESEINKLKTIGKPSVKVTPVSGTVGTKLFIYGWGFRANEDGMTVTWDGEIIVCNIRAELDGSLIIDGSKVPNISSSYTGDTRESIYVPPSTKGRHILGVYGSSFTPRGTVNDTIIEVLPNITISPAPTTKGTQIIISGTGFANEELVTVDFNKTIINGTTNANGNFEVSLVIPSEKGKKYNISASGDKRSSVNTSFETAPAKIIPSENNPELPEIYCNSGFAHFKKAQWMLAISDLEKAYTKNKELNRGSWNKEWAQSKQKQWDSVITDYDKVISLDINAPANKSISASGKITDELAKSLTDYGKAVELSKDPALTRKINSSIKLIEAFAKGL
jgi:tetratricopeptide (TPR) repeat protein